MVQWRGVEMEFGRDIATLPVFLAEDSSVPSLPYYQTHVSLRLARWEEPPQGTVSNPQPLHVGTYRVYIACVLDYVYLYINSQHATVSW